jgi:hypothetical protein
MITVGELVICSAILTIAFLAMLVVFIKNAVEQNTSVPDLILSMFKFGNIRAMARKTAKKEKKEIADKKLTTGTTGKGREMVSKDTTKKTETGTKAKKNTSGFLADLASTMFLWQPSKLITGRKEKFAEKSKEIDSELDKLLAENAAEEEALARLDVPDISQREISGEDPEKARAAIESRLKGLLKNNNAKKQNEEKPEPAVPGNETMAASIKVEKLEIKEGVTPKWDAIIPHKDPAMIAQDMVMLESKILKPVSEDEARLNAMEALKSETNMQLKINDMPVWGHTGLGKPLEEYKSGNSNDLAPAAGGLSASQLQDKNEVERMIKQNMLASPTTAITPPVKVEPVKVEPIKPAVKTEAKEKPSGMDFANDLLKEMEEDEKVEDDSSLDIMGDLKGKKIDADELEFDAMDVLSMIRTNVKSSKQAKGKNKPKARP